jgi:hypothetical protein
VSNSRIRMIRVPLTEEQRAVLHHATGQSIAEALIAAPIDHDEPLINELTGGPDAEIAGTLWASTDDFAQNISRYPAIRAAYESYIGHSIDIGEPLVALLRVSEPDNK